MNHSNSILSLFSPRLPSLGLGYLASNLIKNGHEVFIFDMEFKKMNQKEILSKLKEIKPEVVGVTATTPNYSSALDIACIVKEFDRRITTVIGGSHISAVPIETIRETDFFDIGVVGEGEKTFSELLNALDKGKSLKKVKGIVFRESEKTILNKPRSPIKNLDELPFPLRLNNIKHKHSPIRGSKRTFSMITSRGCPYQCGFCDQGVFGRNWRPHSAERVVDEIQYLMVKHRADFISFEDDSFLVSKKRIFEICDILKRRGLDISWGCSANVTDISPEIIGKMKDSGCKIIYLGLESGSDIVLSSLKKNLEIKTVKDKVNLIKNHGIKIYGSFMIGTPFDTKETIKQTINLSLELPLDGVSYHLFVPYPGTPMREVCKEIGSLSYDWQDYSKQSSNPPYVTKGLSKRYLLRKQLLAYLKFYFRPGRAISVTNGLIKNRI